MCQTNPPLAAVLERIVPWLVLFILATFTYAFFFQAPYLGFVHDSNAEVIDVYASQGDLHPGDRLLSIGALSWNQFRADLRKTWLEGQRSADAVTLRFEREGQEHEIWWQLPGRTPEEVAQRLNSQWWWGYVFWLAGTATLFLVRPKDRRWLLLVAFNYLTAVWLAAGSTSSRHVWQGALVLRCAVWLSVPVYLHLHWLFPNPLGRLPSPLQWIGYSLALALAVVQWFQLMPSSAYLYGLLLALLGSVILVLLHALRHPAERRDVGFLALAFGLVALPPATLALVNLLGLELPATLRGGAFLAFPAIPGAYFFVLYRRQLDRQLADRANRLARLYLSFVFLGVVSIVAFALAINRLGLAQLALVAGAMAAVMAALMALASFGPFVLLPALAGAYTSTVTGSADELHFRANRLLAPLLFFVLLATATILLLLLLSAALDFSGAPVISGLLAALLAAVVVAVGYRPFRRFVDRRLLGMRLPPDRLLETFAARITTSLERESLTTLLADEVLPSLLVRQSVILLLGESGNTETILCHGLKAEDFSDGAKLSEHLAEAGQDGFDEKAGSVWPWLRLALPLRYGGHRIGFWLFGRRDPDNLYSREDVSLLQVLANQTAVALTNILQTENLRALYRENIDRHERERARLARALHDDVLSRLAVMALFAGDEISPESQEAYDALTAHLRQTIAGLRPAMLQYGLRAAIQELADELVERTGAPPTIVIDLPDSDARYPPAVEQHLFRIVQQAVENALRHAQARSIRISGRLARSGLDLSVEDDGIGFASGEHLDLAALLANRHFGLAGMVERAELIQADLRITSRPHEGTRISVSWIAPEDTPSS